MKTYLLVIILNALYVSGWRDTKVRKFSDGFLFGAATAAYQVEGGWDADGKGESIWDKYLHDHPEVITDGVDGDVASDSYHNYKRDVEMLRELGVDFYRFSISWPRILPAGKSVSIWDHLVHTTPDAVADSSNADVTTDSYNNYERDVEMLRELGVDIYRMSLSWTRILPNGFSNKINKAGVDFYNSYIDELLKYNITPMVTLYHWDLPKNLQDLGGFSSPLMADWFEEYARTAFSLFGDRVKHWITFNEPSLICYFGYGTDWLAPRLNATDVGTYYCAKHLVLAHARAYHVYNDEFRKFQGGVIGITLQMTWYSPLSESEEDAFAAELAIQGEVGIYAHPIFSEEGGYPKQFAERVAEKSAQSGYSRSRLPEFTDEERHIALGTADFYGINHYSGWKVSASECKMKHVESSFFDDLDVGFCMPAEWEKASPFLALAPDSLFHVIAHVSKTYNNPPIFITENGWPTSPDVGVEDDKRIQYYRAAWESVLDALEVGFEVRGYMAWSLMDNFEWMSGYSERFGLYEVNFASPDRIRTAKKSAFVYKELIRSREIHHEYSPNNRTMWIDKGH